MSEREKPKRLEIEVINTENGYIIFEGISGRSGGYVGLRKWVAATPVDLSNLIHDLAVYGMDTTK